MHSRYLNLVKVALFNVLLQHAIIHKIHFAQNVSFQLFKMAKQEVP